MLFDIQRHFYTRNQIVHIIIALGSHVAISDLQAYEILDRYGNMRRRGGHQHAAARQLSHV